jgi:carbohydrate kinase (thermoresistant glucokinase family)
MLVVVMGVAGVGKTAVGQLVAHELGLPFHDADTFHSEESRRKMAAGIPLTEEDRRPWLRELVRRMREWEAGGGAVVACSALRRRHRDLLAGAAPGHVRLVFLDADEATIRARLETRKGHYMPPALLDSQLATLERPGPDEALRVDAGGAEEDTARAVVGALSS